MSTAEILKLKITTDGSGKVKADLIGVADGLDDVDGKTKQTNKSLLSFNKVLSGLSVGALLYFSQRALQAADDMSAMASRIGTSTTALQEFEYVGMQYNITQANMDMGLQRLFRRFGDAQRGIGEATKLFQDLNVSLYDNENQLKTNDQIFYDVADSIAAMDDEAAQLSATVKLVDSEAAGMVDVFRSGSDELVRLRLEAHAMGAVMSEDVVEKAADANLQIETLTKVMKTQFTVALTELTPLLVEFGNKMAGLAKQAGLMFEASGTGPKSSAALTYQIDDLNEQINDLVSARASLTEGWGGWSKAWDDILTTGFVGGVDELTRQIDEKRAQYDKLIYDLALVSDKEASTTNGSSAAPVIDPALLRKTTAELSAYRDQIGATEKELLTMQVRTKLQVGANTALNESTTALIDNIIREKEEQQHLNQLKTNSVAVTEQMLSPLERYTQQQSKLNEMLAQGYITNETFNRAVKESSEELEAAQYGQFFADLSEGTEQLQAATNSWASQFTDQLVELAITGKGSFSDLTESIIRDLTRIAIQQAVLQPLMASFGMTAPTPAPVGTGRAAGGGVSAGQLIPINEVRDEVLTKNGQDFLMLGAGDGYVHASKPGTKSGVSGNSTFNVNVVNKNEGAARVENVRENASGGFDLDLIIDQVDEALARRQQTGQSAFGNTVANTAGLGRVAGAY